MVYPCIRRRTEIKKSSAYMTDDFSWGTRTRTRKDRTRICSVANYTIPQSQDLLQDDLPHLACLRVQIYGVISCRQCF